MWSNLPRRTPFPAWIGIVAFCIVTAITLLYQFYEAIPFRLTSNKHAGASTHKVYTTFTHVGKHFSGFSNIKHNFVFGDSWTSTGFEESGGQPSVSNPFGNPEFPGSTATNGPNWVGYLTAIQNITLVKTVNFAYGGSTIDLELIHPDTPALRDFKYQINEQYMLNYVYDNQKIMEWSPDDTLFIIWMGVNDIHNAFNGTDGKHDDTSRHFGTVFEEFAEDVNMLYDSGARNFLFLNVPPLERSPLAPRINEEWQWKIWVSEWNANLTSLATNFASLHPDTTAVVFDTFSMFNDMIDEPCNFEASCTFQDVSTFCAYYVFGAPTWNYTDSEHCEMGIDKYLWMNDLHPTTPVFNVTAEEIVRVMKSLRV